MYHGHELIRTLKSVLKAVQSINENVKCPQLLPLQSWEFPRKLRSCIHLDYAGPFKGKIFLSIIDTYSKWLTVHPMNTATSDATIGKLRCTFAEHGLPDQSVTDNYTCFTISDFEEFITYNGIKKNHLNSIPLSNERSSRTSRTVV